MFRHPKLVGALGLLSLFYGVGLALSGGTDYRTPLLAFFLCLMGILLYIVCEMKENEVDDDDTDEIGEEYEGPE